MGKTIAAVALALVTLGLFAAGCAPEPGEDCTTAENATDFVPECNGDDMYYCVCKNWVGNTCPTREGRWVKQDIMCTCDTWINDNASCPIE